MAVLRSFFGDVVSGGFTITSSSALLGPTDARARTFGSFSQALTELIDARVWAGLHFRTADVQAELLGRSVAGFVMQTEFKRVGRSAVSAHPSIGLSRAR